MTNQEAFDVWAPDGVLYARWVKPVLFSYLAYGDAARFRLDEWNDLGWLPSSDSTALVIDLPGDMSISLGMAVARRGFRPIPLFNAVPLPIGPPPGEAQNSEPVASVNIIPILDGLLRGAEELKTISLNPEAAPAFLLDSHRAGRGDPLPNQFDNRSAAFTTDFPSANFLLSQNIQNAILISEMANLPQPDLLHPLRKWREGGLTISVKRLGKTGPPQLCDVPAPPRFKAFFQRALVVFGLRRNRAGGFGAWTPDPESHGGGG